MIAEIPSGALQVPDNALWNIGGYVLTVLISSWSGYRLGLRSLKLQREHAAKSAIQDRRRDFLAYMKQWKHEIDRWHFVTGGRERRQMSFYDGVSGFCVVAEMIRSDFSGADKDRFVELVNALTYHGKLEYGCKHEDLIKTIDELIAIAEKK